MLKRDVKRNINSDNIRSLNNYKRYLELFETLVKKQDEKEYEINEIVMYEHKLKRIPGSHFFKIKIDELEKIISSLLPDYKFDIEKYYHPKMGNVNKVSIFQI